MTGSPRPQTPFAAHAPSIVPAKLRPPPVPEFAVERPRLLRRLDRATACRLSIVAVPAGYGKTVLLSQWADSRELDLGWLTIDARDHDPARLWTHLIHALGGGAPGFGDVAAELMRGSGPVHGAEVAEALSGDLESLGERVLVVDDADRVAGNPLADLLAVAPPTLHLLVASRADLDLGLHRLRATNELIELRARDLRFEDDELRSVVASVSGVALTDAQCAQLAARTEGWPVAVQLTALTLAATDDVDDLISRVVEDDHLVADFLSHEVLESETPEVRRFLLEISVLGQLSGDLCDAALGMTGSAALLADLAARALFVTPVGDGGIGYLLHRLVGDILRHSLEVTAPGRNDRVRRRAAAWYLEHGEPAEAATLLIDARAWDELAELVHGHGRALFEHGQSATVLGWFEAIPESVRRDDPTLGVTHALLAFMSGRVETFRSAVHELECSANLSVGESALADVLVAMLAEVGEPTARARARGERAIAALRGSEPCDVPQVLGLTDRTEVECAALWSTARAALLEDHGEVAAVYSAQAEWSTGARTSLHTIHATGTAALVDALCNRATRATARATRAVDLGSSSFARTHPSLTVSKVAATIAAREEGRLDDAESEGEEALDLALRLSRWPWVGLLHAEQARIALASGDPGRAIDRVRRCAELAAPPMPPLVADHLLAALVMAHIEEGSPDLAHRAMRRDHVGGATFTVASARLALFEGDVGAARKALDGRPRAAGDLGRIEHALMSAVVDHAEGDVEGGLRRVAVALADAEGDGFLGVLSEAGRDARALARDLVADWPTDFLARALVASRVMRGGSRQRLADPLTDREIEVLVRLPTRLSNAAIAASLYVSVNTVKTHVQHVYQKLDVTNRDDAVRRGRELGLV